MGLGFVGGLSGLVLVGGVVFFGSVGVLSFVAGGGVLESTRFGATEATSVSELVCTVGEGLSVTVLTTKRCVGLGVAWEESPNNVPSKSAT